MEKHILSQAFINQLKKRISHKEQGIIQDNHKIIIHPISNETNFIASPCVQINNLDLLEKNLKEYWYAINTTNIKFTQTDERHQMKYYFTNIWKNATNSDYTNPENFIKRITSFIQDNTFQELENDKLLGYLDNYAIYIKRKEADLGYETPYEILVYIQDNSGLKTYLPAIRYGIYNNKVYFYAIQNEYYEDSYLNKTFDKYLRNINNSISGMENRGVHTPRFIFTIALFLGLISSYNFDEILINDLQISRWFNLTRQELSDERLYQIQYTITNKLMKTFIRLSKEFPTLTISSFPNEIDNYMHLKIKTQLFSDNFLLNQAYLLGLNANKKIKEKKL